ncbi:MAG: fibronectin type III domain-containing protein [Chitinivibrionia bacterium]|nr:fibronectin type III domain-containing protein [Chitinivibrionia bacterium]
MAKITKMAKITAFTAIIAAFIAFFLSCSLEPYGEGRGNNSTGGNSLTILPNIEDNSGGNGGDGGSGGGGNSCTKPSAPSSVSASGQSSSVIKISWNSVSGASTYKVYRATSANGQYSYLGDVTTTSYTNSTLPSSTTYYYKITSVNICGESAYSSYSSATTNNASCTKPSAPGGVSASGQSSSSIKISWNSVSGASTYNVYRSTSASGSYSSIINTASTSYTNTGLSSSATYYYKITAQNICGESAYSSYTSAKPTPTCTTPSAPTGVSCKANWWNEIQTSWNSVSGATSYEVYYSKSANGTYELAGSTTSTTFKLGWLDGSTTYYFKVKALNNCGSSGLSSYSSAKTGLFG